VRRVFLVFLLLVFIADFAQAREGFISYAGCLLSLKQIYSAMAEDYVRSRARELHLDEDFKTLSDLVPRAMGAERRAVLMAEAQGAYGKINERQILLHIMGQLFEKEEELEKADPAVLGPQQRMVASDGTAAQNAARTRLVAYTEDTWPELLRVTPHQTENSLIPVPHPIIVPGARFKESYYWDSYFGMQGLLATGRNELAGMQIDNFLFLLEHYEKIPNGLRTYYLSRSQPPVISMMVVDYLKALPASAAPEKQALLAKALPLLEKDYQSFWMNKDSRFDETTGLNHHWDDLNIEREEKWGADKVTELGKTYRDVRAEAESGKDFTDEFEGKATEYDSVLLNSIMYKYETNLAELATLSGDAGKAAKYKALAAKRKAAFNKYLWNEEKGNYYSYNYVTKTQSPVLTADIFAALEAGLILPERIPRFLESSQVLIKKGGVASSDVTSGKQWDAPYAWAPHQFFAIKGLRDLAAQISGPQAQAIGTEANALALQIAEGWTGALENIYAKTGYLYEKHSAETADLPQDTSDKYPNQRGFLWTNATYIWILKNVFGAKFQPTGGTP